MVLNWDSGQLESILTFTSSIFIEFCLATNIGLVLSQLKVRRQREASSVWQVTTRLYQTIVFDLIAVFALNEKIATLDRIQRNVNGCLVSIVTSVRARASASQSIYIGFYSLHHAICLANGSFVHLITIADFYVAQSLHCAQIQEVVRDHDTFGSRIH